MDEMSQSMAALRVDKSNLEERLAVEKVCEICHSDTKNMKQYGAVEFAVEYVAKKKMLQCYVIIHLHLKRLLEEEVTQLTEESKQLKSAFEVCSNSCMAIRANNTELYSSFMLVTKATAAESAWWRE